MFGGWGFFCGLGFFTWVIFVCFFCYQVIIFFPSASKLLSCCSLVSLVTVWQQNVCGGEHRLCLVIEVGINAGFSGVTGELQESAENL